MADDIVAAIGIEAAEALLAEWGGTRLYVPYDGRATSPVASVIGEEAVEKLFSYYGASSAGRSKINSMFIDLPKSLGGTYPPEVFDLRISARTAALIANLHQRSIYRIRAAFKASVSAQERPTELRRNIHHNSRNEP